MQQDLQYLRGLTSYTHKNIKETYQQSAIGCIPNDKYYIAEGALVNAYPHGQWKYYSSEGIVQSEGFYYKGTKWGKWYDYFKNGDVYIKCIFWNGYELKRIQYYNNGDLYCLNEDCLFWYEHPLLKIPFLLPHEECGFVREKVLVQN